MLGNSLGIETLAPEHRNRLVSSEPLVIDYVSSHTPAEETVEREANAQSEGEGEEHTPLPAGWLADRVLKVTRKSPSAGVSIAYRLIVEGS